MDTSVSNSILTIETIQGAMKKLKDFPEPFDRPRSLFGINIVEVPTYTFPKLKLGKDAPVSDDFRKEFDAWLLERFGVRYECAVPKDTAYLFQDTLLARFDMVCKLINIS